MSLNATDQWARVCSNTHGRQLNRQLRGQQPSWVPLQFSRRRKIDNFASTAPEHKNDAGCFSVQTRWRLSELPGSCWDGRLPASGRFLTQLQWATLSFSWIGTRNKQKKRQLCVFAFSLALFCRRQVALRRGYVIQASSITPMTKVRSCLWSVSADSLRCCPE